MVVGVLVIGQPGLIALVTCMVVSASSQNSTSNASEGYLRQQFSELAITGNVSLGKFLLADKYLAKAVSGIVGQINLSIAHAGAKRSLSANASALKTELEGINQLLCASALGHSSLSVCPENVSSNSFIMQMLAWSSYVNENNGSSHMLANIVLPFLSYAEMFKNDKAYRKIAKIRDGVRKSCLATNQSWAVLNCVIASECSDEDNRKTLKCQLTLPFDCMLTKQLMACLVFHVHLTRSVEPICRWSQLPSSTDAQPFVSAKVLQRLTNSVEQLLVDVDESGNPGCANTTTAPTAESLPATTTTVEPPSAVSTTTSTLMSSSTTTTITATSALTIPTISILTTPTTPQPVTATTGERNICSTDSCKDLAKLLLKQVNLSANPCNDFYAYACGGFVSRHPVKLLAEMETQLKGRFGPEVSEEWPRLLLAKRIESTAYDELIRVDATNKSNPVAIIHAKLFFDLCLQHGQNSTKQARMAEVVAFIKNFTDWPFFNKNSLNSTELDVFEQLGKLIGTLNIAPLLEFYVSEATRANYFVLGPAEFGLGSNISNEEVYLHRVENVKKSLRILASAGSISPISGMLINVTAHEIVRMEKRLAAFISNSSEAPQQNFKFLTGVHQKLLFLRPFLENAFHNEADGLRLLEQNSSAVVWVKSFGFIATIAKLLSYRLNKRTLLHMIMVRTLEKMAFMFDEDLSDPFMEYRTIAEQRSDEFKFRFRRSGAADAAADKDAKRCYAETVKHFASAIDRLYVAKQFKEDKKSATSKLVAELKLAATRVFANGSVINTSRTMENFLNKLEKMITHVGFPEKLLNETELNRWSSKRVGAHDNYFETTLDFMKWDYAKFYDVAGRSDHRCTTVRTAGNACYNSDLNSLTVPAGAMEYPFYDASYPPAFQFGLIGFVIGHEIFHGFDAIVGVMKDENGTAMEKATLFSSKEETDNFVNRCHCLRRDANENFCYKLREYTPQPALNNDEQDEFGIEGLRSKLVEAKEPLEVLRQLHASQQPAAVNAKIEESKSCVRYRHLGETMSDLNGLKTVFDALTSKQRENAEDYDLKLPGLEHFSLQQLFFVAFGTFFCEPRNPLKLAIELELGRHPPSEARVNLAVRHSPEFARAFSCKLGDRLKLNQSEICEIY